MEETKKELKTMLEDIKRFDEANAIKLINMHYFMCGIKKIMNEGDKKE